MKRALLLAPLCFSFGCGLLVSSDPRLGWIGEMTELEPPPRPPSDCRYLTLVIQPSVNAAGMSERDALLAAEVAELMEIEFVRRGARVTDEGESAYFSLLIMAAEEARHNGFVFSAVLAARGLKEAHDGGVDAYAPAGSVAEDMEKNGSATLYHALSWGEKARLRYSVREYVRQADSALLPLASELCEAERIDREREAELERQVAEKGAPL
jgi:hypothetical protein